MSKSIKTATKFLDRDCIIEALVEIGIARNLIEIHEKAVDIFDYCNHKIGVANVVVRRNNAKSWNDLGFTFNPQTKSYDIIRDVDGGYNKVAQDDKWLGVLTAKYAQHRVLRTTKQLGFVGLTKPVRKNGKLILEVIR